jgi:hypothetical protein
MIEFNLGRPGTLAALGRFNGFAAYLRTGNPPTSYRGTLEIAKSGIYLTTDGGGKIDLRRRGGILQIPKAVEIPRNERLYCRCTPAEKAAIKTYADTRNMTVSEYLLETALNPIPE